ncbi:hypothetical protein ABPG75_011736 [Micractinium tetrahymenae]
MGLLAHSGATPWRRRAEAGWPAAERSREHKRTRVSGHVLLIALVGCVLVSMISFNGSSSNKHAARMLQQAGQRHATQALALQAEQAAAGSGVIAGKRHRKLEHGAQLDGEQVMLAALQFDIPLTADAGAALAAAAAAAAAAADGGSVDDTAAAAAASTAGAQEAASVPSLGSGAQEQEEAAEAWSLQSAKGGEPDGLAGLSSDGGESGEDEGDGSGAAERQRYADLPLDEEDPDDLEEMQLQDELARREEAEQAADAAWEAAGGGQGGADDGMENPEQPAAGGAAAAGGVGAAGEVAAAAAAAAAEQPQSQQAEQLPEVQGAQQQPQPQPVPQQQAAAEAEQAAQEVVQQAQARQSDSAAPAAAAAAASPAAEDEQEHEAAGASASPGKPRRKKSPYHTALQKCESLACLREAALTQERHPGQFRFPHFFIIGWQKCATTSLFHHLVLHPRVQCPSEKEPEFFTYDCQYDPLNCPLDKQRDYIQETLHINRVLRHNMYRAMFEGSTHYGREGPRIAQGLRELFPWAKLIASLREPISRGISMLAHNLDKSSIGCLTRRDVFSCLQRDLPALNFTTPLTAWLEAFPREQIMLLQYESLTHPEHTAAHLQEVKTFLELDPAYPAAELEHSNSRESRLGKPPEGWPMSRKQYEKLVQLVRPDAARVAALVSEYGLGDGKRWMANWEKVWQANFNSCNLEDECVIQLS